MRILIANPGSTSYKCKVFDTGGWTVLFQAAVERIGEDQAALTARFGDGPDVSETRPVPDYVSAVQLTLDILGRSIPLDSVSAVGFKTVLARGVTGCVRLTPEVLGLMREFEPLAPVHTRVYLNAIGVFEALLPGTPRVGLFETAFHASIPDRASAYAIPHRLAEAHGIRKYGFHGASHRYVSRTVCREHFPGRKGVRVITCHLGGSSSVCATAGGVSLDTSMGMSPQCGLPNARRVGDLDPFALLYLMDREALSTEAARRMLITESGVYGLSGLSGDFRDIESAMREGDARARLAFDAFAYSVKRYIGEYLAVLNGADAVAFTGGLGQNSPAMREAAAGGLDNLGIVLDPEKNRAVRSRGVVSHASSRVLVTVEPTDEERVVAEEVEALLKSEAET